MSFADKREIERFVSLPCPLLKDLTFMLLGAFMHYNGSFVLDAAYL